MLVIRGKCKNLGAELTPMCPYSQKLLQKNVEREAKNRKRVKPQYYGKAHTSDEIFQRLQDDASKQPIK